MQGRSIIHHITVFHLLGDLARGRDGHTDEDGTNGQVNEPIALGQDHNQGVEDGGGGIDTLNGGTHDFLIVIGQPGHDAPMEQGGQGYQADTDQDDNQLSSD